MTKEYTAMIYIDGEEDRYLVDAYLYYLLCRIQQAKPTKLVLKTLLNWYVSEGQAIYLKRNPIGLLFSKERKNLSESDEE